MTITAYKGDSRILRLPALVTDTGTPIDTSGATGRFLVGDLLEVEVDFDEDPEDSGGPANIPVVTLSATDLDDAPDHRRRYRYELEVTDGSDVVTYQRGTFVVLPDLD
jgi:hypothetical protein